MRAHLSRLFAVYEVSVLACACAVLAQDQRIEVFHRIISHSSDPASLPSWSKRGTYSQAGWQPEQGAFAGLPAGDLYQIGYGASSDAVTSFVSVPECHLHSLTSTPLQDTLTLVLPRQSTLKPLHLHYNVKNADVTRCQPGDRGTSFNTTIQLEYPQRIDGPKLYEPLVVKYQADGTVQEPEPEKSFLQKYWLYILPVSLLVLTSI